MRAAGKRFVSNGCRRRTVIKPGGYICIRKSGLSANSGGTAENVFCLCPVFIEDKGFFIFGGNFMKRWRILK